MAETETSQGDRWHKSRPVETIIPTGTSDVSHWYVMCDREGCGMPVAVPRTTVLTDGELSYRWEFASPEEAIKRGYGSWRCPIHPAVGKVWN